MAPSMLVLCALVLSLMPEPTCFKCALDLSAEVITA